MGLQFQQRFRIIDRTQVDGDQETLVVSSCDDCACPTPPVVAVPALPRTSPIERTELLTKADDLYFTSLPRGHWAVFNPTGNSGIVVIDEAARTLLDAFAVPTTSADVLAKHDGDLAAIAIERLFALELIHPVNRRPQPPLATSDELVAWLHVTNRCNLACSYCYVQKNDESMTTATGHVAIDALVRSALAYQYSAIKLKYAGGEAALVLDTVFDLHDYAVRRCESSGLKLRAVLLSNGLGLLGKDLVGLQARGIRVMVSLDGLDDAHDRQRPSHSGQSTVHKVLAAIEALQEAGISPHLSITVTAQNCARLDRIVHYAINRGLSFSFNLCRAHTSVHENAVLQGSPERLICGLRQAFQVIGERLPRSSVVGTILDRGHLLAPHTSACGVGQDYIVIDHNGAISKCHMVMDAAVAHISDDQPLQMLRQSSVGPHNPPVTSKVGCQSCQWRYFCTGGCPLETYRSTGHYDARSPYCAVYQAIYPLAVELEGLRLLQHAPDARV